MIYGNARPNLFQWGAVFLVGTALSMLFRVPLGTGAFLYTLGFWISRQPGTYRLLEQTSTWRPGMPMPGMPGVMPVAPAPSPVTTAPGPGPVSDAGDEVGAGVWMSDDTGAPHIRVVPGSASRGDVIDAWEV